MTGEFRKQWEEVMSRCNREWEEKIPKQQGTFDQRPDIVRKQIFESYIPELRAILKEAEAALKEENNNG